MTDDEILLMAAQVIRQQCVSEMTNQDWIAFAKAIAAKEREACAELCENITDIDEDVDDYYSHIYATAIRARGE